MPDWYTHPHIALAILFVVGGFWVLIKGADLMVAGAVAIAQRTGLSPAVIGATVVAFGTSLPELVVSLVSVAKATAIDPGPADIAVANVVGSNIFNVGLILGFSALLRRLPVPATTLRLDYPLMILATVAMILFSIPWGGGDASIVRWEGLVLCAGLVAFTVLAIRMGKVDRDELEEAAIDGLKPLAAVGLVVVGIAMLALGGEVALTGAISIAEAIGISDRVIGLTVVAIGTSLPELATSIQAARKGHTEIAVANVVGSNVFNILCIIGIASLVAPLPVNAGTLGWDYWWMGGFLLILLPLMLRGRVIRFGEGLFLVVALLIYVALLLVLPDLAII